MPFSQDASETMETHFELNDTLYSKATIKPVQSVNLWLGVSNLFAVYKEKKDLYTEVDVLMTGKRYALVPTRGSHSTLASTFDWFRKESYYHQ
jgi:hypothetical protein